MKKVLIASGVAVMALAMIATAQGYMFSTNLTVGSTGPDVVALQTWLMNNGFNIPSVASGAAAKGYFGSQTKSAVMAYQAANSIPSTGFVGPLTRGALNAGGGAPVTGTGTACPAGMTCTPISSVPVAVACPAGYQCVPNGTTPTNTGMITTPGVAGTLAFTLQGSPSGATLDKGESEDIARYKLQGSASDMQVTSLSLDFDVRLWLYASSITIKDDSGQVIASKSGLTQNDFTELTVGTSYRLYVPVNYVVSRATSKYFTVNVTMLAASDRCTSTCTLTITSAQVRSVDGTGVTDTQTEASDRTFSFTGTNTGQIVATVDLNSPLKRLVQISNSTETNGVVLGIVDLKSQGKDSTLRTLTLGIKTDGTSVNTMFSRIKIKAGSQEYTANTISVADDATYNDSTSSSTIIFTDLMIPLPKDVYVPITVLVDVAKPATTGALDGKMASTTLVANSANVVAEDTTYNSVTVNAGTLVGSDIIVSASSAVVTNMSVNPVTVTGNQINTTESAQTVFKFTLTAGDNTLFVSATTSVALATSTTVTSGAASSSITTVKGTPPLGEISSDSTSALTANGAYFVVPAGGSRSFEYTGRMLGVFGEGARTLQIDGIRYGTTASNLTANTINYGLGALQATATF